jgi:hypothetical protein
MVRIAKPKQRRKPPGRATPHIFSGLSSHRLLGAVGKRGPVGAGREAGSRPAGVGEVMRHCRSLPCLPRCRSAATAEKLPLVEGNYEADSWAPRCNFGTAASFPDPQKGLPRLLSTRGHRLRQLLGRTSGPLSEKLRTCQPGQPVQLRREPAGARPHRPQTAKALPRNHSEATFKL